jgi:DNA-binding CsgD family transcriptional regulator
MRADDSDILLALYRSAQDLAPWAGFLAALGARTGAKTVQVILQTESTVPVVFGAQSGPLGSDVLARMRYQRPYSGDDFVAPSHFRALRMRPLGGDAWVVVAREGDDFSAATSALLGWLGPHLAQGAVQFWQAERVRAQAAAFVDVATRTGLSWALLSAQGHVVLAADTLPPRYLAGDRLRLPAPMLRKVLDTVAGYRAGHSQEALALPNALIAPIQSAGADAIFYTYGVKLRNDNAKTLSDLFALTPAEARFAAALGAGQTIKEAGETLGFTPETARYYSKQVYAKLGVTGQVEAMRRIENSVYRLL